MLEKLAEEFGLFIHAKEWKHYYTFFGYLFYLAVISILNHWIEENMLKPN